MMPTWLPVKLTAGTPRSARAIVSSAAETRSPVVSSMSISRPGRVVDTWEARAIRLSVALPIADTTTTTSWPWRWVICDVLGDGPHAVRVGDGRAAVLLDDQGHGAAMLPVAGCQGWFGQIQRGSSEPAIGTAQAATVTAMNEPEQAVVDDGDERGAECRADGLRAVQRHVRRRRHPALQPAPASSRWRRVVKATIVHGIGTPTSDGGRASR